MKLTMAQKKSVIVLSRHIDRLDFTTPVIKGQQKGISPKHTSIQRLQKIQAKINRKTQKIKLNLVAEQ